MGDQPDEPGSKYVWNRSVWVGHLAESAKFPMSKSSSVFKIRDKETGLFSTGGMRPVTFTRTGKTWSTAGHLKSHLTMWADQGYQKEPLPIPQNWEIVEFIQIENPMPFAEFISRGY